MTSARAMAFANGLLFALGLGISGMTDPGKVLAFLDVGAHWDPSLALVMVGAISVHAVFLRLHRRPQPYLAEAYDGPRRAPIDRQLVFGAALFGLGWGASGFCPGPALVSLVTLSPGVLVFVVGMLLGLVGPNLWRSAPVAAEHERSPAR